MNISDAECTEMCDCFPFEQSSKANITIIHKISELPVESVEDIKLILAGNAKTVRVKFFPDTHVQGIPVFIMSISVAAYQARIAQYRVRRYDRSNLKHSENIYPLA